MWSGSPCLVHAFQTQFFWYCWGSHFSTSGTLEMVSIFLLNNWALSDFPRPPLLHKPVVHLFPWECPTMEVWVFPTLFHCQANPPYPYSPGPVLWFLPGECDVLCRGPATGGLTGLGLPSLDPGDKSLLLGWSLPAGLHALPWLLDTPGFTDGACLACLVLVYTDKCLDVLWLPLQIFLSTFVTKLLFVFLTHMIKITHFHLFQNFS